MKKYIKVFVVFFIFVFMYSFINVYAEENNTNLNNDEIIEKSSDEENNSNNDELKQTPTEELDNTTLEDNMNNQESEEIEIEEHKVAVITNKVDENGNKLTGATLQIIDMDGNVVDEWISSETEHTSLLPEGDYILHEVSAPEGYIVAEDQNFSVVVEEYNMDAGVDYSKTPCEHYGGTPLYYIESNGEKSEVYCINQDWETPDEESKYDGEIVTPDNIRSFTNQTVYIDAEQNKDRIDISDPSLSDEELYNKILDIIYHRQEATEIFNDLTEAEIRYVTEAALKNYTNTGLTRVQGVTRKSAIPEGVTDYYYDGRYYWYLYPHFRSFEYIPDAPMGSDIFKTVVGEGDAFGTIARHWNGGDHNAKGNEEVRNKIDRFYDLYQYLVNSEEHHPSDMHLYIYSTNNTSSEISNFNFDDGVYQNLLGIKWFNSYDENYKVELECVNKTEIIPPVTGIEYNNSKNTTSNSYPLIITLLGLLGLHFKKRFN